MGGSAWVRGESSFESWEAGASYGLWAVWGRVAFPELLGGECRGGWPAARVETEKQVHLSLLDTKGSPSTPSLRQQMLRIAGQGR